jgi:uncharacterized RDD family membrane protein YckC
VICPSCGAENVEDAPFCLSCRRTFAATVPATEPGERHWATPYYDREVGPVPPAYVFAGFWTRALAYLLDTVFSFLLAVVAGVIVAVTALTLVDSSQSPPRTRIQEQQQDDDDLAALVFGFLAGAVPVYLGYQLVAAAEGGGPGKRIVGLRIVRDRDGRKPGYGTGAVRVLSTIAFGLIPFVGNFAQLFDHISAAWDRRKQTWHDKVAGTIVIEA